MKAKGELFWQQLSMWDFSPDSCIEGYRQDGEHTFHYVLKIVDEITGERRYRTKVVTDFESVPKDVHERLMEGICEIYVKSSGEKVLVVVNNNL